MTTYLEDLETRIASDERPEEFLFLGDLRRSGSINMFGAGPYVQRHFDLSRAEASRVVGRWTNAFTPENR